MKKKFFSLITIFIMVISLSPVQLHAESGGTSIEYKDSEGNIQHYTGPYTEVTNSTTEWSSGWYVVRENTDINTPITISGEVSLVLTDRTSLVAAQGVLVNFPNSLTVYGQSEGTGRLTSYGIEESAGIGGAKDQAAGTIIINSGNIIATGSNNAAGIGGGSSGNGGTITINGGNILARGGSGGTDIGPGNGGNFGTFSTGTNGAAVIFAETIQPALSQDSCKCIHFKSTNGIVYGDVTLKENLDFLVFQDELGFSNNQLMTLQIPEGATLIAEDENIYITGTTRSYINLISGGHLHVGSNNLDTQIELEVKTTITDSDTINKSFNMDVNYSKGYIRNIDQLINNQNLKVETGNIEVYTGDTNFTGHGYTADLPIVTIPRNNIKGNINISVVTSPRDTYYIDENGKTAELTSTDYTLVSDSTTDLNGTYVVRGSVTVASPIIVSENTILILEDKATLEAEQGIKINKDKQLIIYGQQGNTGDLVTFSYNNNPGIGNSTDDCDIRIYGGRVWANINNSDHRADSPIGICGAEILIEGGTVFASGNDAGIKGEKVHISKGKVTAAPIAKTEADIIEEAVMGNAIEGDDIIISGGLVDAHGSYALKGNAVTISGGLVKAKAFNRIYSNAIYGTFSTGENGNAVIHARDINDKSNIDHWQCIQIFDSTTFSGIVYGNVKYSDILDIDAISNLSVGSGSSLTMDSTAEIEENCDITLDLTGGGSYHGRLCRGLTLLVNVTSQMPGVSGITPTQKMLINRDRTDYIATLSAEDGYRLPEQIIVKIGSVEYPDHGYNKESPTICIDKDKINGNISFSLPLHDHAWSEDLAHDGTYHWHECTALGCTIIANSKKSGYAEHVYDRTTVQNDDTLVTAGDCTNNAVYRYTCVCGVIGTNSYEKADSKDMNSHISEETYYVDNGDTHTLKHLCCNTDIITEEHTVIDTDSSCLTAEHCICGCVITEACANHNYGDWTAEGNDVYKRSCTISGCDGYETETRKKSKPEYGIIHNLKSIPEVPATVESTGMKEHFICIGCDKLFIETTYLKEVTVADLIIEKLVPDIIPDEKDDSVVENEKPAEQSDDKTTEQDNNKAIEQDDNKVIEQDDNKATEQDDAETTKPDKDKSSQHGNDETTKQDEDNSAKQSNEITNQYDYESDTQSNSISNIHNVDETSDQYDSSLFGGRDNYLTTQNGDTLLSEQDNDSTSEHSDPPSDITDNNALVEPDKSEQAIDENNSNIIFLVLTITFASGIVTTGIVFALKKKKLHK